MNVEVSAQNSDWVGYAHVLTETYDLLVSDEYGYDYDNYNPISETGSRQMFDRRNGGRFNNVEPYLFDTSFTDGLKTEIQINPEFTLDEATVEANKYAFLIGQLPTALRKDVETMWIHKGIEAYGGGNNKIFRLAKTSHVLVLNPDTILSKNCIKELIHQANLIKNKFAILV